MKLQHALFANFLGHSPRWYKQVILLFLLINPVVLWLLGPVIAGWLLVAEFIFTLAMALKCYPLQPGGLLAVEAILLGLTNPETLYHEVELNLPVLLLLMFMVAGIYFLRDLLLLVFTRLLLNIRSKILLSLVFCGVSAFLSAFLDALTVTAVIITVSVGFYGVYHRFASGKGVHEHHDQHDDSHVDSHRQDLAQFRAFLRSLLMHAAVGTALGGVCTMVGEPQNLLIAKVVGWNFKAFFQQMAPVSMPVLVAGLTLCVLLERFKWFGYGATLPESVREVLADYADQEQAKRNQRQTVALVVQLLAGLILVAGLALHVAEVGLMGLLIIIVVTAFNGVTEEHQIGHAFTEALPFLSLLVVFFAVVGVIHDQHLFTPIITAVLAMPLDAQPVMLFIANGLLSMISDNVFVATVYISEIKAAFDAGSISREHFELLAISTNTGTNIPSVATPNGQAAFLFLLTSTIAPLVRLSYGRMVIMALPYTVVMSAVAVYAVSQL